MVPSGYLYGEAFYDRSCTSDSRNPYCGSEVWFLVIVVLRKLSDQSFGTISFRDLSAKTDSSLESARSAKHDGVLGVVLSLRRSVL